ncbi:MAG: hypothetical protein J2P37_14665, partial [Ktedonobacteraceae bacterium]|nr:hypothetical protein [Ktedonobacteraceae bacterium]
MELSHNDAENANQQPSSTGSEDTQERPAELEQNESSIEELPTTTHESVQPEDSRNKPHEEAEEPTVEELPTTRIESVRPENASSSNNKPEPEEEQEETTGPDEPPIEELPTTRHESVRAEKKPDGSPAAAKEQIAPDRANGEAAAHQNGKPRSARRQTLVPVNDSARAGVDIRQAGTALERAPGKNSRLLVPVKTTADSERRFSTHDQEISRRTRVNRLLMRRRRHLRLSRELAPRVTLALAIVLIVLTTLFSGSAGAAYAYYQAQMPLLDGIAQHSLFQTTRIYDRNGKLLYELYNKQEGQGRRTYVNYNDISPL